MAISESQLYYDATKDFLANLRQSGNPHPVQELLARDLFEQTIAAVEAANITLPKSQDRKSVV